VADELRVAVTGLGRQEVLQALSGTPEIVPVPLSDMEAAVMLQKGELPYVIGVCESGGGAALAIAIAIVGSELCTNLTRMGRPVAPEELPGILDEGRRVFGLARDHIGALVPALARAIVAR
jgi:hypothetical protein